MEPVSLTIGGIAAALVLRAADKSGEQLATGASAAVGRLVERLRRRFHDGGDAAADAALTRVEDPPVGKPHLEALAAAVDRHASEDPAFAAELGRLVEDGQSAGVDVAGITQVVWGSHNVVIGNVTRSTVNVNTDKPRG